MFEALKKIDEQLLLQGNGYHNSFFDTIMPYLTSLGVWVPLFIWISYELYKHHRKKIVVVIFFIIGLIIAADRTSVGIKNVVKRYRPTHNLVLQDKIHVLNEYRGGQYGFVSSHATNSFALAVFLFLMIRNSKNKWLKISLFAWAIIFCYSRIYLGVHYPFDILGGALLGTFLGILFYKIYSNYFLKIEQERG